MNLSEYTRSWRIDHLAFRTAGAFDVDQAALDLVAYVESPGIGAGHAGRQQAFASFWCAELGHAVVCFCEFALIAGEICTVQALTGPVK